MQLFIQRIFDGVSDGAVYASIAVALVLIFKATTLINFAQGEMAMFGAFFAYIFAVQSGILDFLGNAYLIIWVGALISMILSAVLGVSIERVLTRPFDPEDHLPVVLITLGLFLGINAVAGIIWNYQARIMPSMFPNSFDDKIEIFGARLFYDTIGTVITLGIVLYVLFLILNKTKMGLAFRAVSANVESGQGAELRMGSRICVWCARSGHRCSSYHFAAEHDGCDRDLRFCICSARWARLGWRSGIRRTHCRSHEVTRKRLPRVMALWSRASTTRILAGDSAAHSGADFARGVVVQAERFVRYEAD